MGGSDSLPRSSGRPDEVRDKIFEGAWDAVKLAICHGHGNLEGCVLITQASVPTPGPRRECLDLFDGGVIARSQGAWLLRAATIEPAGPRVRFGPDPEFPQSVTKKWLAENVPNMSEQKFQRILKRLRNKRWSVSEIEDVKARRSHPSQG